ncbi:MAG: ATP-binding protein [Peptostreptococcaceae bacterium]
MYSFKYFLIDKSFNIFAKVLCLIIILIFVFSTTNNIDTILTITSIYFSIMSLIMLYEYRAKCKYFKEMITILNELDKKYLLSEVLESTNSNEYNLFRYILKECNKSMLDNINILNNNQIEYKDYVESWVHEIKTPVSCIKLINENNKTIVSRSVLEEIEKIDQLIDQTLFYARSEHVQRDYLIKEINLNNLINETIINNKRMFLLNNIELDIDNLEYEVFSDSKWLAFIISQLLINSVKYSKKEHRHIKIYASENKTDLNLVIEDNGIGIPICDIKRVFEKGFTGSLGRKYNDSTGMGLYICKKLCSKLNIGISIESNLNEYTKVSLTFPKGSFYKI